MMKPFLLALAVAFSLPVYAIYDPLPPSKEGLFPIEKPDYHQVDQLLLLSNRWVIVCTTTSQEVVEKLNELSHDVYKRELQSWTQSEQSAHPNWSAKRHAEEIYANHIVEARNSIGEKLLDTPDFFSITSPNDPHYHEGLPPTRVTRYLASLGKNQRPGEFEINYAHYSYLQFPFPMENGKRYTIKLGNGKSVDFLYDEQHSISRAIKVNQVGYLPDSQQKYAYLGCYLQELGPLDCSHAKDYAVISVKTGEVVLKGELKLRASDQHVPPKPHSQERATDKPLLTGEDTYQIDLNGLREEGEFFITIPGIGRSWTFIHSPEVYGEVFYTAARGLYHQRCGIAIGEPYTAWPRIRCHTDPVYESEDIVFVPPFSAPKDYQPFDVIGKTLNRQVKTDDATGGWHDAADWDRNLFHYLNLFDLLYAYELVPTRFFDGQLNIPESGDGIPDILDEVEYGLRVWRKSLDSRGGASGEVETRTHPTIDDPRFPYAYSQRTRWSSLLYAAAAAQYAQHVAPFNKEKADLYASSALQAYKFGNDPTNSLGAVTIHAAENRGEGKAFTYSWEEKDKDNIPYLVLAKLRLFLLTHDQVYLDGLPELLEVTLKPYEWPFSFRDFSPWIAFSLFARPVLPHVPEKMVQQFEKSYLETADQLLQMIPQQPYRISWPLYQDYWMEWGNATMTNRARALLIAHWMTKESKYREGAIVNADYMLGNNPMGISWTTGLGYVYPIEIQHAVSELDGIKDPVPGITIYGTTGGMYWQLKKEVWESKKPDGTMESFMSLKNREIPLWRSWSCHPHFNPPQCEFTIHETISSTIFTAALLMPDKWMPSKELKQRRPRQDQLLFGFWYLP